MQALLALYGELQRRRVFRGTGAFIIVAWLALFLADLAGIAGGWRTLLLMLAAIGVPLSALFSWIFRVTGEEGLHLEHHHEHHPPRSRMGLAIDVAVLLGIAVVAIHLAATQARILRPEPAKPAPSTLFARP